MKSSVLDGLLQLYLHPMAMFVWGVCLGSFVNVVVHRAPGILRGRGESLLRRSACPDCGARISWAAMTPVLGWIALGGRCGSCGGAISARYPIVEGACGLIFLVSALVLRKQGAGLLAAVSGVTALAVVLTAWRLRWTR